MLAVDITLIAIELLVGRPKMTRGPLVIAANAPCSGELATEAMATSLIRDRRLISCSDMDFSDMDFSDMS